MKIGASRLGVGDWLPVTRDSGARDPCLVVRETWNWGNGFGLMVFQLKLITQRSALIEYLGIDKNGGLK